MPQKTPFEILITIGYGVRVQIKIRFCGTGRYGKNRKHVCVNAKISGWFVNLTGTGGFQNIWCENATGTDNSEFPSPNLNVKP